MISAHGKILNLYQVINCANLLLVSTNILFFKYFFLLNDTDWEQMITSLH